MPGIVVFHRRWAVGSDDLVVPGLFLCVLHSIWLVVLSAVLATYDFSQSEPCVKGLYEHILGYVVLLSGSFLVEAAIAWVSLRGTILYPEPRASMQYLLYIRLGILFVEIGWLVVGMVWLSNHYASCPIGSAKDITVGIVVCNWCVVLSVLITLWCTFDAAGRSWVKMKNYQRSLRDSKTRFNYKRSGSLHRDWRHRKVVRAYQESWNTRCRLLCCCVGKNDRHRNSFAEIAKLLSDFFRDLDVVPSDVIAGLVLLRQLQKLEKNAIVAQRENDTYEFLSGIPITPNSRFLALHDPEILDEFKNVIHYMRYALAVYGWPMYIKGHAGTGVCHLCPYLRCCCLPKCCRKSVHDDVVIVQDNCCHCNHAAMCQMLDLQTAALIYVTYHGEVGETPFFVAVDHRKKKIVVSIRGTLSLQDVITDLNAEGELLPTDPPQEDWIGHKGMVQAAVYIRNKLREDFVLSKAFGHDTERGTHTYDIVLVGHSLGAGTAAILAILLKQEFPNVRCYAYSPPGGLLSMPAVEYSKSFITSVVVGKDVVPRIGLHQMEALRSDLINAIKGSRDPKWKVISSGVLCCRTATSEVDPLDYDIGQKQAPRDVSSHPSDSYIALTVHQPLFPPGRILHVVRHHPTKEEQLLRKPEPVYQALWAENTDFDEVLISPVMIQDHMPDKVLEALEKVLSNVGPPKPQRIFSDLDVAAASASADLPESPLERTPPHKLCLETSFTDLNPEQLGSSNPGSSQGEPPSSWEYNGGSVDEQPFAPRRPNGQRAPLDWTGLAPLATPETLSDASSLSSRGSSRIAGGRFSTGSGRQEIGPKGPKAAAAASTPSRSDYDEYFSECSCLLSASGGEDALREEGLTGPRGPMMIPTPTSLGNNDDTYYTECSCLLPGAGGLDPHRESGGPRVISTPTASDLDEYYTESSCLLSGVGGEDTPLTTEVVVEVHPSRPPASDPNALELESDGEGPLYEGARLSFDLSQDTSCASRTSEDTGYHGDQEVFVREAPRCSRSEPGDEDEDAGVEDTNKREPRVAPSAGDSASDVYSNPSPLASPPPAVVRAWTLPQEEPSPPASPLRRLQSGKCGGGGAGSPNRKWTCGRQAATCCIPHDIISQARIGCNEDAPRMCFHHDNSPDESSV